MLADDRLLTNASLLVGDNARLLVELLRPGGPKLELAGELTGLVSQNPITSVQRGRLAPAMLQLSLLIAAVLRLQGRALRPPGRSVAAQPARVLGARARDRDAVRRARARAATRWRSTAATRWSGCASA